MDYPFLDIESAITQSDLKKQQETEAELKRQRIERFAQFFGRVNSALTLRKVRVRVENSTIGAPAWSGASEVFVNNFADDEKPAVRMLLEGSEYNIKSDLGLLEPVNA